MCKKYSKYYNIELVDLFIIHDQYILLLKFND